MRVLLIIAILLCCTSLYAQTIGVPPFKPGAYKVGDRVSSLGIIYVNQKKCESCAALPSNSANWKKEITPVPIVVPLDSIVYRLSRRVELLETQLKTAIIITTDTTITVNPSQRKITW